MTVCDFYHLSIHQNVYLFYPVSYLNLTLLSSCTQGYQSSLICDCCKTNASQLLESHQQIKEVLFKGWGEKIGGGGIYETNLNCKSLPFFN